VNVREKLHRAVDREVLNEVRKVVENILRAFMSAV